jgi:hypothetical protein
MQFVLTGNGGQDRRASAAKERRRRHQQRAQHIQQVRAVPLECNDEAQRHHRPDQIAGHHNPLAVETVQQNARQRAHHYRWNRPREHHSRHHHARVAVLHGQAEHRDIIEVVPNLAHHLAAPREAIVAIAPQQLNKIVHQDRSVT